MPNKIIVWAGKEHEVPGNEAQFGDIVKALCGLPKSAVISTVAVDGKLFVVHEDVPRGGDQKQAPSASLEAACVTPPDRNLMELWRAGLHGSSAPGTENLGSLKTAILIAQERVLRRLLVILRHARTFNVVQEIPGEQLGESANSPFTTALESTVADLTRAFGAKTYLEDSLEVWHSKPPNMKSLREGDGRPVHWESQVTRETALATILETPVCPL
eukprot:NODE_4287_length_818_cov_4.308192_g3548_i0.p1 GENE.NODE_4287_length_818_cov_4.308192_g3548_i0~~NODE_4287_length_818_cov_4.308192_g3548_i0.p1  ORF type:complete len:216 (+),score=33.39 NODE_4287_length_818_cov_4.308192_g3548_i0:121-768(+)